MNKEYIAFTATINGVEVRMTVDICELDIVSRDNTKSYPVQEYIEHIEDIVFESIY